MGRHSWLCVGEATCFILFTAPFTGTRRQVGMNINLQDIVWPTSGTGQSSMTRTALCETPASLLLVRWALRRLGGRNGCRGAGTRLPGYGRLRVECLYEPYEVRDRGWEGIRSTYLQR